ncbi:unnamed protein product [Rotaria sordida]|uniref:Uncharacterized protein n=2 Tax=Rotaria sordida TaxID=392033 RepID=A0A814WXU9_9BILA|nr:unnamed protein product [Rotaria sordida]
MDNNRWKEINGKETEFEASIQDHLSDHKLIYMPGLVDGIEAQIKKSVQKYRRTRQAATTANRAERK